MPRLQIGSMGIRCAPFVALAAGMFASSAHAQLLISTDDPTLGLWLYAVNQDEWRQVASGPGTAGWGLAADDAAGVVYIASGITLYRMSYQTLVPEFIGLVLPGGSMTGLAYGNGSLFGIKATQPGGLHLIETSTGQSQLLMPIDEAFDFGGLAFNQQDGLLYATNDSSAFSGAGLYRINASTQTITYVTAYLGDTPEPDVDGLAMTPSGRAYLVSDEPGDILSYKIDLNRYQVAIPSPITGEHIFAGAAWAPGLVGVVFCPSDISGSPDPSDPAYGRPDGVIDTADFFYFLDRFVLGDAAVADLTGTPDPGDPGYGQPDGVVDAADFFFFLDRFVEGCA